MQCNAHAMATSVHCRPGANQGSGCYGGGSVVVVVVDVFVVVRGSESGIESGSLALQSHHSPDVGLLVYYFKYIVLDTLCNLFDCTELLSLTHFGLKVSRE